MLDRYAKERLRLTGMHELLIQIAYFQIMCATLDNHATQLFLQMVTRQRFRG